MKALFEQVAPKGDTSWAMLNRRLDDAIPFQWHHHPEFELTLTLNSRGQRFIGDHTGTYDDGDLVLIGPNLPHTWASSEKVVPDQPHVALVMWFLPDWAAPLGGVFSELRGIADMLQRASAGLKFSAETAPRARLLIEALFTKPSDERVLALIEVLALLSRDRGAEPLSAAKASVPAGTDRTRIDRVLDFLHAHYEKLITIETLADIAALSPSGLHRLFRRHTGLSVTAYLMRLRIGEACAMLSGSGRPIAHIADEVGYASLANFNRQFKSLKQMTPRAYRGQLARPVRA
jgi:AraC-like DNA-binding protein